MNTVQREAAKYDAMWNVSDYRKMSPGIEWMPVFLQMAGQKRGSLIDLGCGTGEAGKQLSEHGFDVTLQDITCSQVDVDLPVIESPIWSIPYQYAFGYCCDVMEHIPTEYVMLALSEMCEACDRLFLTICTLPDSFGLRIGQQLHLTVRSYSWWYERLSEVGTVLDARDCLNTGVFYVARD